MTIKIPDEWRDVPWHENPYYEADDWVDSRDHTINANAELVATAIATFLVEEGAMSINEQIVAIRQQYALAWRTALIHAGFDNCASMPTLDIAEGVDLALSRLLDAAQEEYADAQKRIT